MAKLILKLQCRTGNETWCTVRTIECLKSERREVTDELNDQRLAWSYTDQFIGHVWRVVDANEEAKAAKAKPAAKSQVIFKGAHYTACAMRDGSLIVTSNKVQRGKRIVGKQALHWIDEIKTAIDNSEAHALCRAVYTA